ncbi:MAG: fused MFS/spermidine synthase, partial [Deltaproteobacteria bacterium]|nr:fused MFS/spermidine synthase [Deltaproteobacteria bacterium]
MKKKLKPPPTQVGDGPQLLPFLLATALICGAAVMVVEVLGSRVIGPFFGASLYVWTSLITVTLVALAVGYWFGGILSDRSGRTTDWLYGLIALAGILVLLVPLMKAPIIKLVLPLGLRMGSLVSAGLLFGPALLLLGMVSPLVIRTAVREIASIGRTVGLFSSVSTVGSFIGTVCTGFILIAYFNVDRIFVCAGGGLLLLSVVYAILYRRSWMLMPLLLLPFLIPEGGAMKTKFLSNGILVTRIFFKDSFYGNMQVLENSHGNKRTRQLVVDATIQGGIDMASGASVYEYPYFLQFIPRVINPNGKECLVIGLGAGVIPMWYERQGVRTDVVDIDPLVFDVARRFFAFNVSGESIVEDARYYLNRTGKRYDYVILDVFNGDNTPFHVLSKEALMTLKQRMTLGGVLGINVWGNLKGDTYMTASIIRTLKEVFSMVDIYPTFDVSASDGIGNLELFAYDRAPVTIDISQLAGYEVSPMVGNIRDFMYKKFEFPINTPAITLTDGYNPIDFY